MHRSSKEKSMTSPDQQLLQHTFYEAMNLSSSMSDVEISAEFTSIPEKLKSTHKKSFR